MKRFTGIMSILALSCLMLAGAASAGENSHNRAGFFIGFGAGWGSAGADFEGIDPNREASFAGNFRFGWAVNQNITIGLENTSWSKDYNISELSSELRLTGTVTTFAMTFFPQNQGFYMRGGLGVATGKARIESAGFSFEDTETGFGLLAATGYEWRLTGKFALGPQVQYAYLNIDGDGTKSVDFLSVTAQATWYW